MELFSKRNNDSGMLRFSRFNRLIHRPSVTTDEQRKSIISETCRQRLKELIKYVVESGHIEPFLLTKISGEHKLFFNSESVSNFSRRELGYDLGEMLTDDSFDESRSAYSDLKLFDLLEFIIIFAKKDNRKSIIDRIENVFSEEGLEFVVHDYMIFARENTGLRSIVSLIKNPTLKKKLEEMYGAGFGHSSNGYQLKARASADALQYIFSSSTGKNATKNNSEKICKAVAEKLTEKTHVLDLAEKISQSTLQAKNLGNQIGNIRHTDQYTIPVDGPDFYKFVAAQNTALVELVILSLPENYISTRTPESLKNDYLEKYEINKDNLTVLDYLDDNEIKLEDIPF